MGWNSGRKNRRALGLVLAALVLSACSSPTVPTLVPSSTPAPTLTPRPAATGPANAAPPATAASDLAATPAAAGAPSRLVVCMLQEPSSLYPAVSDVPVTLAVQQALYDGLIDTQSYQYQPVAFTKLPYVPDGDAAIETVTVGVGDRVFDAATSQVVAIAADTKVLLNQVDGPAVSVDFSQTPTATTVRQWAQWTQVPGMTWEDGTPVTSDDALFAYEVARNPATPKRPDWVAATAEYEAVDDQTIRWVGVPGYATPTYYLNHAGFLPKHAYGRLTPSQMLVDEQVNRHPLAYGPYTLAEWVPNDHILLRRNPTYWRAGEGLPRLDEVVLRFVPDTNRLIAQVVSGRCDVATQDGAFANQLGLLRQFEAEGLLQTRLVAETIFEQMAFNTAPAQGYTGFAAVAHAADGKPIFSDPRVRQGLAHCLDRQAIIDQALSGAGVIQETYAPEDHPLYAGDDHVAVYSFDPAAGLSLLAEAGWRDTNGDGVLDNGQGVNFAFVYSTRNSARRQAVTRMVQDQLAANCHVQMSVELHGPEYTDPGPNGVVLGRRFDVGQLAFRAGTEPPCALYTSWSIPNDVNGWEALNLASFSDPEFDEACVAAQRPGTPEEKAAEHARAQEIWAEALPAIVLYAPARAVLTRPGVVNVLPNPTAASDLWNIENFAWVQ
jgi:peptide/nickel transport system substrate-binding protein